MKPKTKSVVRGTAYALLYAFTLVAFCPAFNLSNGLAKAARRVSASSKSATDSNQLRVLTFADRVAYQRAIEEVYWRHRIWPQENAGPKPPLDKVITQAEIEKKVENYMRNSQALEDYWQRPIAPDQLQGEMERIASHTRQSMVLREIFAALGNDPFVIAECLARPLLADRLIIELYGHDQGFYGESKRRTEAESRMHPSVGQMTKTSGRYTEMEWVKSAAAEIGAVAASVSPA